MGVDVDVSDCVALAEVATVDDACSVVLVLKEVSGDTLVVDVAIVAIVDASVVVTTIVATVAVTGVRDIDGVGVVVVLLDATEEHDRIGQ